MESKCLYYSLDCQGTVIDVFAYTSDFYFARPGMMMNEEINYNHRSILVRQAAFCIICEQFPWLRTVSGLITIHFSHNQLNFYYFQNFIKFPRKIQSND